MKIPDGPDIFGRFPETSHEPDKPRLSEFIAAAGTESIGRQQLADILKAKQCERRVQLIEGDILETVPQFVANHPELKIALLHIDVDIYEPTRCVLESLLPHVSTGGVIILDDYGIFPGATKAVDEIFALRKETIAKLPFSFAPTHIVKQCDAI